ncbi:helix-turn-helix domain-containing protein [Emticicia sp. SJ17W-69]|uniref:helix-turn-helix domain-containing protein n=1 Tax=Emticicia sp. SJ17W-69 TaxID=3421657 RepID=UPI003EB6F17B
MLVKEILPNLALQAYIKSYLIVRFDTPIPKEFATKPYPTRIEQSLNFFARGYINNQNPATGESVRVASTAIFGQQVCRLNFETIFQPDFLMLMVNFKAGAMHRLLRIPNQELTTKFCDAEPLFSTEMRIVNDLIANAKDEVEIVGIADEFFLKKVRALKNDANQIDKIGELLLTNPTHFSLNWLADQACLSPRQFERRFTERMGISPKFYSRINRFYQTFLYKETNPGTDWLTVALNFGYTDYYHLAKDFKQFANTSPKIMLEQYARRPEVLFKFFEPHRSASAYRTVIIDT